MSANGFILPLSLLLLGLLVILLNLFWIFRLMFMKHRAAHFFSIQTLIIITNLVLLLLISFLCSVVLIRSIDNLNSWRWFLLFLQSVFMIFTGIQALFLHWILLKIINNNEPNSLFQTANNSSVNFNITSKMKLFVVSSVLFFIEILLFGVFATINYKKDECSDLHIAMDKQMCSSFLLLMAVSATISQVILILIEISLKWNSLVARSFIFVGLTISSILTFISQVRCFLYNVYNRSEENLIYGFSLFSGIFW